MIRTALYDPATKQVTTGGRELAEQWTEDDARTLWVDIEGEAEDVELPLLRSFGIHELAIQDAMRTRHPPKIEAFDNFLFILLRGLDAETTNVDFGVIQLSLFVRDNVFITRHKKKSVSANALFAEVEQDAEVMSAGPPSLAVRLSNKLMRRYIEILLDLEPRLDAVEAEMFERPNDGQLAELTRYKSKLRHLARIARYHKIVVAELRKDASGFMPDSLAHELTDLYEQIERTESLSDLYYQVAADLTDGYIALSSHRLNGVMQILTIITVLFVPLTFLAGIYGMNFEYMPELSSSNGYFVVIGIMLVTAIFQLIYFRRKGWL
ncbi:MAG: magnesium transporter CorA family protein [Pseudomonadales bacterium]